LLQLHHELAFVFLQKRRRNEGYLKHGVHFRKTGESRNSQYIWNVEKCLEVFDFWKAPNKKIEGTK